MEGAKGWSDTRHSKQYVTGLVRKVVSIVFHRHITEEGKVINGCGLSSMTNVEVNKRVISAIPMTTSV